jgi:two-component system nitrogen regulation sensor histidine kinase NtrY
MNFKSYPFQFGLRLIGIILSITLGLYLAQKFNLFFTLLVLMLLILVQIWDFWRYQSSLIRETKKFLEAARFGDYSTRFELASKGGVFADLEEEFMLLLTQLKTSRASQDNQEALLGEILKNINLGILGINGNKEIFLINEKAQEILDIPPFQKWERLSERIPELKNLIGNFDFTGRKLWEHNTNGKKTELYLDLQHIKLKDETFHLISLSNLHQEVEEKEIDAWHKLIRILAHEVMNSVTPVVSLSETVSTMLVTEDGKKKNITDLEEQDLDDIREACKTIVRRSKGMLSFVDEYRKLTQLPAPAKEVISIKTLFEDCLSLLQASAKKQNCIIRYKLDQQRLALNADRKMIEQVLVNLIKNALAAMPANHAGEIELSAKLAESGVVIRVSDNGEGIEEDLINQIFVPFFSTRKNGSGIGLSLSKNIMKMHGGDLKVQSQEGVGSSFLLQFKD